jgi:nucleoside-diphosphate-sugar epimerase
VGTGFLARHLRPLSSAHRDVVVLAAGVSSAASSSAADFDRERALLERTIRRCRQTGRRLVFFSTASTGMYGAAQGAGREDVPVSPVTPYGMHKLGLEERVREAGIGYLVLRLGHVTGPGQPAHQLLPSLVRQVRAGRVTVQRGSSRDLISVRDTVAIIGLLLGAGVRDQTVNVASGSDVAVERIVDHLAHRLGRDPEREYVPGSGRNQVSVAKLRALVPAVDQLGFGADYYLRVLDAVPAMARAGESPSDQDWSTHAFPA